MSALIVPARAHISRGSDFVEYIFPAPVETLWDDICTAIREACKRHPNYRIPVDNGGVCGETDKDKAIPINTLGRWLFGTPGYQSHKLLDPEMKDEQFVVRFHFPNEAPPEVRDMLESLTPEIIRKNCRFWGNREYEWSWVSTRGGI